MGFEQGLDVVFIEEDYPKASTCAMTIQLLLNCLTYSSFKRNMIDLVDLILAQSICLIYALFSSCTLSLLFIHDSNSNYC